MIWDSAPLATIKTSALGHQKVAPIQSERKTEKECRPQVLKVTKTSQTLSSHQILMRKMIRYLQLIWVIPPLFIISPTFLIAMPIFTMSLLISPKIMVHA